MICLYCIVSLIYIRLICEFDWSAHTFSKRTQLKWELKPNVTHTIFIISFYWNHTISIPHSSARIILSASCHLRPLHLSTLPSSSIHNSVVVSRELVPHHLQSSISSPLRSNQIGQICIALPLQPTYNIQTHNWMHTGLENPS